MQGHQAPYVQPPVKALSLLSSTSRGIVVERPGEDVLSRTDNISVVSEKVDEPAHGSPETCETPAVVCRDAHGE